MLEYSNRAKLLQSRFFEYRNDVDVYTEDKKEDVEFYRTLFRRIVNGKIKLNDVYPIGCKNDVISAHDEYKRRADFGRKKVFVVDGDLDLILNANPPNESSFYVLSAYCIENFLIDDIASVKLAYYSLGSESFEDCMAKFDYDNWIRGCAAVLVDLFLHLALLKEVGGSPEVRHATQFLSEENGEVRLDSNKINAYKIEVRSQILNSIPSADKQGYYDTRLSELKKSWGDDKEALLSIVSGKDYLLPLLQFRINNVAKKQSLVPRKSIKLYLADNCKLERFDELRATLLN